MDKWATAVDDDSYQFDKLLPYYKQSVQLTPPDKNARLPNATAKYEPEAYDSTGGPLQLSFPDYPTPWSTWVRPGLEAIGINETDGFSMGSLMGAQYCPLSIRPSDKTRSTSESSFLATNKSATLVTFADTFVKKILFDKQKKATGVEVKRLLDTFTLKAKREVILSAGAFQSPQMLMVSGIGPADTLREHGIDVLADLPGVGQNMWDHPFTAANYRVNVLTVTKVAAELTYLAGQLLNDLVFKDGPFTNQAADYLAWEKLPDDVRSGFSQKVKDDLSQFPSDWPEIEVCIKGCSYSLDFVPSRTLWFAWDEKSVYEAQCFANSACCSIYQPQVISATCQTPSEINPKMDTSTQRSSARSSLPLLEET